MRRRAIARAARPRRSSASNAGSRACRSRNAAIITSAFGCPDRWHRLPRFRRPQAEMALRLQRMLANNLHGAPPSSLSLQLAFKVPSHLEGGGRLAKRNLWSAFASPGDDMCPLCDAAFMTCHWPGWCSQVRSRRVLWRYFGAHWFLDPVLRPCAIPPVDLSRCDILAVTFGLAVVTGSNWDILILFTDFGRLCITHVVPQTATIRLFRQMLPQ